MDDLASQQALLFIALALVANGLAGLVGGLLSDRWLERRQPSLLSFAAGALLGAAFLDVLPEAVEALGPTALTWAFGGFLAFGAFEWLVGHHHPGEHGAPPPTVAPSLLAADALHNVADGAVVAAAFLSGPRAGLAVALAVVAHEVPQEVGDYVLLRAAGLPRRRALLLLGLVQLTAVVGAAGVLAAASWVGPLKAIVLAFAAGSFLYIGATDLLPAVHSGKTPQDRRQRLMGLLLGIGLMTTVYLLTPG